LDEPTTPAPKRKRNARAGKPPAFQQYPADFLADENVICMTTTQVGAYALLLNVHWRQGSIPSDPKRVAAIVRLRGGAFRRVWSGVLEECFQPHPEIVGRLIQKRMFDDLRSLQIERERKQEIGASGGRKSAELRAKSQAPLEQVATSSSASSTASAGGGRAGSGTRDGELPLTETLSPTGDGRASRLASLLRWKEEFDRLWKAHPPRRGTKANKPKAWEAYRGLRPSPELAAMIAAGHERAKASDSWVEGYVPDLHRWIKAKGWEDEHGVLAAPGWKERFLAKGDSDG
jgi:uncharacterized protein YdaU (DUF1376 family)